MSEDNSNHNDLDDNRKVGEWKSRFDRRAWIQIICELIYLILLLIFAIALLIDVSSIKNTEQKTETLQLTLLNLQFSQEVGKWYGLALAGLIGGAVFDLKWLYHSVAKGLWNIDRCLWRLIVPINSAMVSLFTGFLFASGIVPFLKNESFNDLYTLLGSGFVFGYFSDNILAAMQNLAQRVFGTLDSAE